MVKDGVTDDDIRVVLNAFVNDLVDLMIDGVKFCFCMNTTCGMQKNGLLPEGVISDPVGCEDNSGVNCIVGYATDGITALAGIQQRVYQYVPP